MSYQLTTLSNGLRVASETLPGMESVGLSVAVDVGARYEHAEEGGLAHMLEHMAFKGTKRRNAREIAEAFDGIGGHLNAYTSLENTVYYARVLRNDLPLAMDVIGDILRNSVFDDEELGRERQVILQEIAMHHDTPDDLVFDLFHEAAYPEQPVGRSILGTPEHVAGFARGHLLEYVGKHYHPSRIVLAAAGAVRHDALVALAEEHFAMPPGNPQSHAEPARYVGGERRVARDLEQLHLVLGFPGVPVHHPDFHAIQIFASILGGGMSSRLFQEVREKRGLVYGIQAMSTSYSDTGVVAVYSSASPGNTPELLEVVCAVISGMAEGVTEEEFRRAKAQYMAGLRMARESVGSVSEWIARHLLVYGRYLTVEELQQRVDKVTMEDLTRIGTQLPASAITLGALGPVKNLPPYEKIQGRLC